jgi:hypothetical protein
MPQSSTLVAKLTTRNSRTADFANTIHEASIGSEFAIGNGTTDNLADLRYLARMTLAASATQNLDLNGVMIDELGAPFNPARIVALMVVADDANTNDVVIGGAGANAFVGPFGAAAHTVAVRPGGTLLLFAPKGTGWPVTAATADLLKLTNSAAGTAVSFSIALLGRSV